MAKRPAKRRPRGVSAPVHVRHVNVAIPIDRAKLEAAIEPFLDRLHELTGLRFEKGQAVRIALLYGLQHADEAVTAAFPPRDPRKRR